jgi:hypothetical protein
MKDLVAFEARLLAPIPKVGSTKVKRIASCVLFTPRNKRFSPRYLNLQFDAALIAAYRRHDSPRAP